MESRPSSCLSARKGRMCACNMHNASPGFHVLDMLYVVHSSSCSPSLRPVYHKDKWFGCGSAEVTGARAVQQDACLWPASGLAATAVGRPTTCRIWNL
eukprot:354917-Chlamydomonas_euryale.AAC.2